MAWNEPGNNSPGNRNPWGQRPNQGPPDLDEVVRNLKKKLSALFGGGGSGGNGGSSKRSSGASGAGVGLIALVLALLWVATGVYQVDAAERAVITRFGQYVRTTSSRSGGP